VVCLGTFARKRRGTGTDRQRRRKPPYWILGLGYALFFGAAIWVAAFPVSVAI
jgi:hypothetical protein